MLVYVLYQMQSIRSGIVCDVLLDIFHISKPKLVYMQMAENEICCIRDNLTCEKRRSSDLEKEVRHLRLISSFPEVPSAGVLKIRKLLSFALIF